MRFAPLSGFHEPPQSQYLRTDIKLDSQRLAAPQVNFQAQAAVSLPAKHRYRPPTRSYSSAVHGALGWIGPLQTPCRAVLSEGKTAMADYRCYLVNNLDQIESATELQCAEDSEAMLQAGALAQSQSLTVEIWNGARLVGRVPRAETQR
jgi:hypothetical protein